jgi:Zn-dependent protease
MESMMPAFNLEWFIPLFRGALFGLIAMALHEVAHIVAAFAVGLRVKKVGFCWKGMYTVREAGPPVKNLFVSSAGPLANLLLVALWSFSPVFGLANLCCGVVNFLPIEGSDGKRILKCLREMRESNAPAQ